LITLQKQKTTLESKVSKLSKDRNSLSDKLIETMEKTKQYREKREAIERSFKKIEEVNDNDRYLIRNQRTILTLHIKFLYIYFLYLLHIRIIMLFLVFSND